MKNMKIYGKLKKSDGFFFLETQCKMMVFLENSEMLKFVASRRNNHMSVPSQTKISKNAFKRTNGNRDCEPLTLVKKTHENAFIGVFYSFLGVKTTKISVFER